ncbi:type II toxin-antitoxin system prevent-host-death family antitoxin [Isoptericola hypogeus]|uniref:Antitoxin n=1 Tax=Isoptericola hypogeus TaxID=300179 RepID=A0ABN2JKY9_9MICO
MTTMSARDFNHHASAAKRAADRGPVVITERGRASHVLLSIEEYRRLTADLPSLARRLSMGAGAPDADDVDFEPGRVEPRIEAADL